MSLQTLVIKFILLK